MLSTGMSQLKSTVKAMEAYDRKKLSYIQRNYRKLNIPNGDKHWNPQRIIRIILKKTQENGLYPVTYKQKHDGFGRYFCRDNASVAQLPRQVRNEICKDLYYDLDIVDCVGTMATVCADQVEHPTPALQYYRQHRKTLIQELAELNSVEYDDVKKAITSLFHGGGLSLKQVPDWLQNLRDELKSLLQAIYDSLIQSDFRRIGEENALKKQEETGKYNPVGSTVALLFQTMENRCLQTMMSYARMMRYIRDDNIFCQAYDGIQLLKKYISDVDACCRGMEEAVKAQCGFSVKIINKPMDETLNLPADWEEDLEKTIIITDDEQESSLLFAEMMASRVKRVGGKTFFVERNGVWTDDMAMVDSVLMDEALDIKFFKEKDGSLMPYSQTAGGAMTIVNSAKVRFPICPEFIDQLWESNKGKLVFKDGVYDFSSGKFLAGFGDVLTTIQIDRNYPSKRNAEAEQQVHDKILDPILGDLKIPFLQFLARAMAGHVEDKHWGVLMGERDSGKGVLAELIRSTYRQYIATLNLENLLCQRLSSGGDEEAKFRYLFALEFARLAISDEMRVDATNKDMKLDGNKGKKLTSGGDRIMTRKLYQMPREVRIQATLLMNCNDFPTVDPIDFCEKVVPFGCPHKFTNDDKLLHPELYPETKNDTASYSFYKPADNNIKEFCRQTEIANAFFWIVADHYRNEPVCLTQAMEDFKTSLKPEDDEWTRLIQYIEFTRNDTDKEPNRLIRRLIEYKKINMSISKFFQMAKKRYNVKAGARFPNGERGLMGLKINEQVKIDIENGGLTFDG